MSTEFFDPDETGRAYGEEASASSSWAPDGNGAVVDASLAREGASSWPEPPSPPAFHGLAGEFVELVSPHSEADPVALLAQFVVAFGSVIGRAGYFMAEADRHYTNLFAVLVGETAKARKGTSWGLVKFVLEMIDDAWPTSSGLSSGEGLIWSVRDPIVKQEPIKEKHRIVDYAQVEVDPGVADKRLCVFQPEFAGTLHVMERDGNTLSSLVRQAWDDGNLNAMTKNTPARATGAHIAIVGHITRDELLRYLDRTEMGNGFANRILWVCTKRSKLLPEGGRIAEVDFAPLVRRIRNAVTFARQLGQVQVRRDAAAAALWREVYPELSEGRPGLLGAITSRAEAQVMRLALVYALLDWSQVIARPHLEAALALWGYADASARYIFGDSLGDPVADELLAALRAQPDGMTRDGIVNLFGRHRHKGQINRVLQLLVARGLAFSVREETGGRPAERWYANAR